MVDDLLRDLAKFGRHEEVGLSHPDIEERNITGISASVLPERFDLKARREARLKAEREAALFSMPPTDVPPRVRQLVVGVGLVCFIGALVAANFASTSSATTLMVLSMIGAGAVAVAMPAGTKRVWISRVVFILAAVSLVYVIDPTGLVRLSAARGRLEISRSSTSRVRHSMVRIYKVRTSAVRISTRPRSSVRTFARPPSTTPTSPRST
jgi:hypothetical protein